MSDDGLTIMLYLFSIFGFGWVMGRTIKLYREVFRSV